MYYIHLNICHNLTLTMMGTSAIFLSTVPCIRPFTFHSILMLRLPRYELPLSRHWNNTDPKTLKEYRAHNTILEGFNPLNSFKLFTFIAWYAFILFHRYTCILQYLFYLYPCIRLISVPVYGIWTHWFNLFFEFCKLIHGEIQICFFLNYGDNTLNFVWFPFFCIVPFFKRIFPLYEQQLCNLKIKLEICWI